MKGVSFLSKIPLPKMPLSKFIIASAVLHAAVGVGLGRNLQLSGLDLTQRVSHPLEIASLNVMSTPTEFRQQEPQPKENDLDGLKPHRKQIVPFQDTEMLSRSQSLDDPSPTQHPLVYHGVNVARDGISERYTSQLHAFLQRHFNQIFSDYELQDQVEFALYMTISADGQVSSSHIEQISGALGKAMRLAHASVGQLQHVPAPGKLAQAAGGLSVVVPVVFHP